MSCIVIHYRRPIVAYSYALYSLAVLGFVYIAQPYSLSLVVLYKQRKCRPTAQTISNSLVRLVTLCQKYVLFKSYFLKLFVWEIIARPRLCVNHGYCAFIFNMSVCIWLYICSISHRAFCIKICSLGLNIMSYICSLL